MFGSYHGPSFRSKFPCIVVDNDEDFSDEEKLLAYATEAVMIADRYRLPVYLQDSRGIPRFIFLPEV
jgi:hypothetical protein